MIVRILVSIGLSLIPLTSPYRGITTVGLVWTENILVADNTEHSSIFQYFQILHFTSKRSRAQENMVSSGRTAPEQSHPE